MLGHNRLAGELQYSLNYPPSLATSLPPLLGPCSFSIALIRVFSSSFLRCSIFCFCYTFVLEIEQHKQSWLKKSKPRWALIPFSTRASSLQMAVNRSQSGDQKKKFRSPMAMSMPIPPLQNKKQIVVSYIPFYQKWSSLSEGLLSSTNTIFHT